MEPITKDRLATFIRRAGAKRFAFANAAFEIAIELRECRAALAEVVDGTPAHHLAEEHAPMTIERAREIRRLAGLDANG